MKEERRKDKAGDCSQQENRKKRSEEREGKEERNVAERELQGEKINYKVQWEKEE